MSWHPASGRSYDHCDNVGPAAVSRFFGGPGTSPRIAPFSHHQVTNLQIQLDRGGQVRLTSQGWRFDYWAPIVDQPIELAGCYANNENH